MSIRSKVFLIVISLFAVLVAADFLVQRLVVYPSFLELERREAGENLQRIHQAIDREVYHVERLCRDWATWDDTYVFMSTRSEDYIESNLGGEAMDIISLNVMAFCAPDGTIIWGQARDYSTKEEIPLELIAGGRIPVDHPVFDLTPSPEGGKGTKGIIDSEQGPLIFCTREVLRSDGSGPSNGFLIMGRLLNGNLLETLREQTRLNFEVVHPLDAARLLCSAEKSEEMRNGNLTYHIELTGDAIETCTSFSDPTGRPFFGVQYRFPRETTKKGLESIRYAMALVVSSGVLVLVIMNILLQAVVLRPLKKLTDHASRLQSDGDYSLRLNLSRRDEVGVLARSLDSLVQTISERTLELRHANERLTELSNRDAMTGVANRRMFDAYLKQEWRRAMRDQTPISVILADVDCFKNYNDTHGHQQGDQCLIAVAAVMQQHMQRPADLVARYGGEEFAVVMPHTDSDGALHMAERLRQAVLDLRMEHDASPVAPFVTLSLGVATVIPAVDNGDEDIRLLIENADHALYEAKNFGRNRAVRKKG